MMLSIRTGGAAACAPAIYAAYAQTRPADPAIPHLEKRGGAEPPTSAPSNLEYLRNMFSVLAGTHQNTAAIALGWNWIEPEKGKYDFRIADAAIEDVRRIGQRIVLVWFGSWKNGVSSFAPVWVKADQDRFPRTQTGEGKAVARQGAGKQAGHPLRGALSSRRPPGS